MLLKFTSVRYFLHTLSVFRVFIGVENDILQTRVRRITRCDVFHNYEWKINSSATVLLKNEVGNKFKWNSIYFHRYEACKESYLWLCSVRMGISSLRETGGNSVEPRCRPSYRSLWSDFPIRTKHTWKILINITHNTM